MERKKGEWERGYKHEAFPKGSCVANKVTIYEITHINQINQSTIARYHGYVPILKEFPTRMGTDTLPDGIFFGKC